MERRYNQSTPSKCVCVSVCHISLSKIVGLYLSFSVSLFLCLSLSLCLFVSLYLSLCPSLYHSLFVRPFVRLSLERTPYSHRHWAARSSLPNKCAGPVERMRCIYMNYVAYVVCTDVNVIVTSAHCFGRGRIVCVAVGSGCSG